MTPAESDRVFGRSRLQVATGEHVEVFREEVQSGHERRYTKRFLAGPVGDLSAWTTREWQVLQSLGRHTGVPVAKGLELLPADAGGPACLQTRDAGATVDQWATLVPLRRGDVPLRSVFEDCAHWWALARHCMLALDAVHALGFVHLELKPDNICIPWAPAGAGRPVPGQPLTPRFRGLVLIDVAFSLLPEVDFETPLPLLRQPAYEYQSPRLLHALEEGRRGHLAATRALDWRCDFFSLAAMLWRYLPELDEATAAGWSTERHRLASAFIRQLLDLHGAALAPQWPHWDLIARATQQARDPELAAALQAGCTFDPERAVALTAAATPPTRVAEPPPPPPKPEVRRETTGGGTTSAPMPLADPPAESEPARGDSRPASAPAPLSEPAHESPRESTVAAAMAAMHAMQASRAGLAARRRKRRGLVVAASVAAVALAVAGAAGWWFTRDPESSFGVLPLHELAGHAVPASAGAASGTVAAADAVAAPASSPTPAPVQALAPVAADASIAAAASAPGDDLDALAAQWLRAGLPRAAEGADRQLARVLKVAGGASELRRRGDVRAAARAVRAAAPRVAASSPRGQRAHALNEQALSAYGRSSDVAEALALQTKALGANPLDSEVAGNLAFLRLKDRPPQAESARLLALHALALNDARFPTGRLADWTTLAIASALTGRDGDARNAWFVSMALADDPQTQCSAAIAAEAVYGERVRPSVQALLQRARSSAAYGRCEEAGAAPAASPARPKANPRAHPRARRAFP